jgi:hypothetical protein
MEHGQTTFEVKQMKYPNLFELLSTEPEARDYFNQLPDNTREQANAKPGDITSLQSLKDFAERLSRR